MAFYLPEKTAREFYAYVVNADGSAQVWDRLTQGQAIWRYNWLRRQDRNNPHFTGREFGWEHNDRDGSPSLYAHPAVRAALIEQREGK